jgi:MFS family permease
MDDEQQDGIRSSNRKDETVTTMKSSNEIVEARHRYGLVVFAMLYTFLVFGAFFGWGPMQLLLEENGSFSSKCTEQEQEDEEICPEQSSTLVNIHFYALVSQVTSPLLGQIGDRYGAKFLAYCMTACACIGFALLVVATQFLIDGLLYPAYILYGITTWMGAILNMQVGQLFGHNHTRSRVIFVLSSLFDAGAITFLGLRAITESTNATVPQVIGGYFGLTVVLFGGASYFWTVAKPVDEENDSHASKHQHDLPTEHFSESERTKHADVDNGAAFTSGTAVLRESDGVDADADPLETSIPEAAITDTSTQKIASEAHVATPPSTAEGTTVPQHVVVASEKGYVLVAHRTPRQQLTSYSFLLLAFFWMVHCTSNQWALTTTRDFLAYLGDDEVNNKYLTIFTFMMPVSLAALPFTDAMLSRFGFGGGFQCINILAVGYSLIRLLSDNLNVQVVGFVIFSFFRSFLFGICLSFLPVLLAPEVVGRASGLLFAMSGISAFINVPLSSFAIENQNGDFFIPNLIYTLLIIPCMAAAWGLAREIKREDKAKDEINRASAHLRQSLGGVLLRDADETTD